MKRIYLSLGSNLGDRVAKLRAAIQRLAAPDLHILRVSPVYETEPVDHADQPWFLNLIVEAETDLFPLQLLSRVSRIERALGRTRTVAKGPRTLDIDILLYGNVIVRSAKLEIPHPRMTERRFVLMPLANLAPDLRHPASHRSVRELLEAAPAAAIRHTELDLSWTPSTTL
jgi:2-amino-4-hydroxy-6-hydroxymethyldihydropteridine diphosphokinase